MDKIDGVVVSVGCGDFLRYTLPAMKRELDHITVVTSPSDIETHKICQQNEVDFLATDCFYRNRAAFNKGMGLRLGLANIKYNDWVLCLDADIHLPQNFKEQLFEKVEDKSLLYGFDRFDLIGFNQYQEAIKSGAVDRLYWWNEIDPRTGNIVPLPYRTMLRCQIRGIKGDVPIGFGQLFHHSHAYASKIEYPHIHPTAEMSDVSFALQWEESKRIIIDGAILSHISSESTSSRTDWDGRKTKRFKPTIRKNEPRFSAKQ